MTGLGTQFQESDAPARARQRLAWVVILVVIGVLLVVRGFVGTTVGADGKEIEMSGFGKVFVERTDEGFRPEPAPDSASREKWVPTTDGATISWTEWSGVTPAQYVAAELASPGQTKIVFSWARTIGLWVAAFFTLAVFSFLLRDNPAYKFTESVVVGVSAAYWMTIAFWNTLVPKLFHPLAPTLVQEHLLPSLGAPAAPPGFGMVTKAGLAPATVAWLVACVPLVLGVLLLCRLNRKTSWLGIFPLAFIVGTFAGLKFVQYTAADLLAQVATMFKPLVVVVRETAAGAPGAAVDAAAAATAAVAATPGIDWAGTVGGTLSALLIFIGVMSVLIYFFFSLEHKGAVGKTARVGIWFLMITFGANFGFTVMGRIALLAGRFEFLFDDWLWLIDPSNKH